MVLKRVWRRGGIIEELAITRITYNAVRSEAPDDHVLPGLQCISFHVITRLHFEY